jgi:hypothetical protein
MLTPSAEDPKRKEELARAKTNPAAFGQDIPKVAQSNHNLLGSGLVADKPTSTKK